MEEKYVLDNFRRPELSREDRNATELSKDVRILVVIDYLLTELNGMKVVPSVLDSIAKGESTSHYQLIVCIANEISCYRRYINYIIGCSESAVTI